MSVSGVSTSSVTNQAASMAENEASISVLKKTLDIAKQQGMALAQMIDQGNGLGRSIDITA